ncbi:hypothetical protein [Chryseolinea lacunae]|uniref:Uncharacterized protein n=1 Tax=Chryseolinea lacunae TaxID=2801331 RepID=A0ABS1L216_9BACT|nr:hypothetical protein [Chryseolinea lacunae]MBL0745735.1 hypothetical protein [Chryseolinea lacunae]
MNKKWLNFYDNFVRPRARCSVGSERRWLRNSMDDRTFAPEFYLHFFKFSSYFFIINIAKMNGKKFTIAAFLYLGSE